MAPEDDVMKGCAVLVRGLVCGLFLDGTVAAQVPAPTPQPAAGRPRPR
jgi:hypothetical protein